MNEQWLHVLVSVKPPYAMQNLPYVDKSPKVQGDQALCISCLKYAAMGKNNFLKNNKKKYNGIWYKSAMFMKIDFCTNEWPQDQSPLEVKFYIFNNRKVKKTFFFTK